MYIDARAGNFLDFLATRAVPRATVRLTIVIYFTMKSFLPVPIHLAATSLAAVALVAISGIACYGWLTRTPLADASAQVMGRFMGGELSGAGKARHR